MTGCSICGASQPYQITSQGKQFAICANHALLWGSDRLAEHGLQIAVSEVEHQPFTCEITGETGPHIARLVEVGASVPANEQVWTIHVDILKRMLTRNLHPAEWKALAAIHGPDSYQLHTGYTAEGVPTNPFD